jgi:hypothetical protein
MPSERKLYLWQEIDDIPDETGIYAWYYRHTLADFDINKLITDLGRIPPTGAKEAAARVTEFFRTHLFQAFVEEPYDAVLKGPLKPTYEGQLANTANISPGMVERIVAEPARLWTLKKVLKDAVPEFASPIYIGMAVKLGNRLRRHKSLIERYKAAAGRPVDDGPLGPLDDRDHSFAREVVRRGFSTNGLAVAVRPIDAPENAHVDAENILNRINYPLCGRN